MEQFPHLNFKQKVIGKPRFKGNGTPNERTLFNKNNRRFHGNSLFSNLYQLKEDWEKQISDRQSQNLFPINNNEIPLFLHLNPDLFYNINFDLKSLGIEIISEEDDGYIIGASLDGLRSLEEKINDFIKEEYGSAIIAELWEIIGGKREHWKTKHILSDELNSKWEKIDDNKIYTLEVSVAFDRPIAKKPDPSRRGGKSRLEKYEKQLDERDENLMQRQNHFEGFINTYGKITSSLIDLSDSFGCEVEITGKGLKDLVVNYPFVFEISEKESVGGINGVSGDDTFFELEILAPNHDAVEVGVIDSGIMEGHKYIAPAINSSFSKSYIGSESSTADKVKGGGHGTKVAGAILFPNGISGTANPYQLPCYIRNLRVLNDYNHLENKFPAELMKIIVEDNQDCQIFNLSINSSIPFRKKHMSTWAATIDSLINEKNILFIISAGNITKSDIKDFISKGKNYPEYLNTPYCKLANPAQSSFALTVGSINHAQYEDDNWKSLGNEYEISAFSRIGTGIWNHIKPDVVEFGGGLVVSKDTHVKIKENEITSPELLHSTLHGGNAVGKDCTGTSFAAPKVTHIVAQLKKLYLNENVNLLRALIVQGARLPNQEFEKPTLDSIRFFGYGLPMIERVTKNSEHRITFYNVGEIRAEEGNIYSLTIPEQLSNPGNDYDILIEVTLAYTAKVRRTRQNTRSYLSTWLDWTSSKLDETLENFVKRSLVSEDEQEGVDECDNVIKWKIRERDDWGDIKEIKRQNSTIQKDWAILKSFQLPKELCFAVRAHKGWDKDKEEIPYAIVVSIEVLKADVPIYELIRIENEVEIDMEVPILFM